MTQSTTQTQANCLGPLANLIGVWEGAKGDDIAPSDDRGVENNKYRERMVFENAGLVENHEQKLYVLRYSTQAWRVGEEAPFHEELGYWTYEPATRQVMRCFLVPRGIALIAGGEADPNAKAFHLRSSAGSPTFGMCTNPFLDREFKMTAYEFTLKLIDNQTLVYEQDTVMQMKGRKEPFHHTDKNTLKRA